jgi:hypothetical protein
MNGAAGANAFFKNITGLQPPSSVKSLVVNLLSYVFKMSPCFAMAMGRVVLVTLPELREC